MSTGEPDWRREAIRRRLNGERRIDICRDLERSTRWFNQWWSACQGDPHTDFSDRSRAPRTVSATTPPEIEPWVVEIRQRWEASHCGLMGARAIWGQLIEWTVQPLPSEATIGRIPERHGLTHRRGAATERAYYPGLPIGEVKAVQASDIITKPLRGGAEIQNFHTLDFFTHAAYLSQHTDKSSATACAHRLGAWERRGFPGLHQWDNEGASCGGHTHPLIIGRLVRLCLWCGVEAFFTPLYEPKGNHQIETFHSLGCQAFWSRQTFQDLPQVRAQAPVFSHWYHPHYRPPALEGKTPAQRHYRLQAPKLTTHLRRLMPNVQTERLPVTAGRFHIRRKVDAAGYVELLNQRWLVGTRGSGEYVRATINTARQTLTLAHKASDQADWKLVKTRIFRIPESVHDLLPQFKSNRARCRDYLPG